jgi:ComF family protein
MNPFRAILADTLHLFYPHLCAGCGSDLLQDHELICIRCIVNLPHTGFASQPGNPVEKMFWGRMNLHAGHSECYFDKAGLVQQLVHELKYRGNQEIGIYLGRLMAGSLVASGRFSAIDCLVPLPLFAGKERKRGYNQAAIICKGLSSIMDLPVLWDAVKRENATETQTKKHRAERWENVSGSFVLNEPERLTGKHVLLVDDVITTGASLEACGEVLLQAPLGSLSVCTLAIATK